MLGRPVPRVEDARLLTAGGTYVADIRLDEALHVSFARSTTAHALITVEAAGARRAEGVSAVVTAEDLDIGRVPPAVPSVDARLARPLLAEGVVRYVGEPVAAVVAESPGAAADAAELVVVDHAPLPAVVDPETAVTDAVVVFPEIGTNVVFEGGDDGSDDLLAGCDVVVRERLVNQRIAPCPLEARSAAAHWDPADQHLTWWIAAQRPHAARDVVARLLGLAAEDVRVVSPDVGGSFGSKGQPYPEELLVAWLARHLGAPVRWSETRSESMVGLGHGRAQVQEVELGGRVDGTLLAYRLRVLQDIGAWPHSIGPMLPWRTRQMTTGVYAIPRAACHVRSVLTNTVPVAPYRGAGRPEATAAIERAVDLFAARVAIDPAEVRRRNLVPPGAFPHTTPVGTEYDSGEYGRALTRALAVADYTGVRSEQARRRTEGGAPLLGVGIAAYVEITSAGPGGEHASVAVEGDESVVVRVGSSTQGQGHRTVWAQITADRLGLGLDRIVVESGDTATIPTGVGTMSSRSAQVAGVAVLEAAGMVADMARRVAADALGASIDDVVHDIDSERFHLRGASAVGLGWPEVARAAAPGDLAASVDLAPPGPTFPFGVHVAVVEVDPETGRVALRRLVAVDDAGRLLNPLVAEGQVHGGLAQGIGQALHEEFVYDAAGNPRTTTFADYGIPSAAELPSFDTRTTVTPTPRNTLGVKGIGEGGATGSAAAVQNAVVDALAHLGVRHLDPPATPERVWRAIRHAAPIAREEQSEYSLGEHVPGTEREEVPLNGDAPLSPRRA